MIDTVRRLRCYGRCLLRDADLVNVRAPRDGRTDYIIASGPCPKCGAGGHVVYGEYGPADVTNVYNIVGIKVAHGTNACNAQCMASTALECRCACAGANHGIV